MIKNYFKVAFRNIFKQKGYSFINITGLAIGMACSMFMLLWISDEMSFDKFHTNAENIYRVELDQPTPQGMFHVNVSPFPMGPGIKNEIPEIKNTCRNAHPGVLLLTYKDKKFFEDGIYAVDPSFFEMFSFPIIKGDKANPFAQPFSIVMNEDMAVKYFGNENPVGKVITLNNNYPCTVTAVMQNIPLNSTMRPAMVVPIEMMRRTGGYIDTWGSNEIITWVQLNSTNSVSVVNKKITDTYVKNVKPLLQDPARLRSFEDSHAQIRLMKISDIRLYSHFGYDQATGSYQSIMIFAVMASFILLIACINFMNLATARSAKRAKEVGLRKTVGALRGNIASQFYLESILMTAIAFTIAIILVEIVLPVFNDISGKQLSSMAPFTSGFIPILAAVAVITGILSGTYPALYLSKFKPIEVINNKLIFSNKNSFLRKGLVVLQFSLSIILIAGTFILFNQLDFMQSKKLGYDKDLLIYLPLQGDTPKTYTALKTELLKDPTIKNVSGTFQEPTFMSANGGGADWDGKNPEFDPIITIGIVDYDYIETMKIDLVESRSFSQDFATDTSRAVIVNEEVAKLMGAKSVVGKRFDWAINASIIGVMKNYHYQPVQNSIEPIALYVSPSQINYAIVRLAPGNASESIEHVKAAWQRVNPVYPFEYEFFDQILADMLEDDRRMATLFEYAAIIAIFIACLGLFGLATFMIDQRTKEIGIRKALGASVPGITTMLSKEFVKWLTVANIIAAPISFFLMNDLLMDYAYRISISLWLYFGTAALTVAIAIFTIGFQSIKAARSNPVNSLKYE